MKILVTGQSSYAGTQFAKRMAELNKEWKIDFISVRDNAWQEKPFSGYDAVYHVAGIVHKKEKEENREIYYRVNRDLTYELALKAKSEGVKSFVFLSSIAVYGIVGKIGEDTIISQETKAFPTTHYGKSKLEAEELLESLQSTEFSVAVLRVPMIFGPNCPGNYQSLSMFARKIPIFPKISNKRSMIFIDNLSDVVAFIIKEKSKGVLLIKNPEDVSTLEMVRFIRKSYNKRLWSSFLIGHFIKYFGNQFIVTRKMFSSVFYCTLDSQLNGFEYHKVELEDSILLTEGKSKTH